MGCYVRAVHGEARTVAPVVEVARDGARVAESGDMGCGEALGEEELDGRLLGAGLAEGVVCGGVLVGGVGHRVVEVGVWDGMGVFGRSRVWGSFQKHSGVGSYILGLIMPQL